MLEQTNRMMGVSVGLFILGVVFIALWGYFQNWNTADVTLAVGVILIGMSNRL